MFCPRYFVLRIVSEASVLLLPEASFKQTLAL